MTTPIKTLRAFIPRQHGAWVTLCASILLGAIAGGRFGVEHLILFTVAIAALFARSSIRQILKPGNSDQFSCTAELLTALFSVTIVIASVVLILYYHLKWLPIVACVVLPLFALSLYLSWTRKEHSMLNHVLCMFTLSLLAPTSQYAARGVVSVQTAQVFFLSTVFFIGSLLHVRNVLRFNRKQPASLTQRMRLGWATTVYHLLAFFCVALYTFLTENSSLLLAVVLFPVTIKTLAYVGKRFSAPVSPQKIGMIEFVHTALFIALSGVYFVA